MLLSLIHKSRRANESTICHVFLFIIGLTFPMLKVKIALFQQSSRYNRITSLKSILHYVNNDVFLQILSTLLVQKAGNSHHS